MSRMGSGPNGELTFMDLLSMINFCVGLENLDLNVAQDDLDKQTQELDRKLRVVIDEIHSHLESQDKKIDAILQRLEAEQ